MRLKSKIIATAVLFAAAVGTACAWYFIDRDHGIPTVQDVPLDSVAPVPQTEPTTEPPPISTGEENGLTGMAKSLLAYNADTVGWITIPETKVNNPIVQKTTQEESWYYLDVSFGHEPYRAGTVFLDYRDVFGFDEDAQSDNLLLYGHNMANNTMFGSLRRYRQDLSFYKTAPFIELYSNYQHYTYVIFGQVITSGSGDAEWRYWDMEEFADKQAFDDFVDTVHEKNMVDIPIDVQYGDKLLTLSTCYSDADNSRFLVIARRLREDETPETFAEVFAEEPETTEEASTEETTEETTETEE